MTRETRTGAITVGVAAAVLAALILGGVAFFGGSPEGAATRPGASGATGSTGADPMPSADQESPTSVPVDNHSTTEPGTTPPDGDPGQEVTLVVSLDTTVRDLTTEVPLSRDQTMEGAIAAFADYAAWLLSSPAAKAEPQRAGEAVGRGQLNTAHAHQVAMMGRSESDAFRPELGVFRGLGHSGDATVPDSVMVEVLAPLTMGDTTRWAVVGGVISWTDEGWVLTSIEPHAPQDPRLVEQNESETVVETLLVEGHLPDGIGWQRFADE